MELDGDFLSSWKPGKLGAGAASLDLGDSPPRKSSRKLNLPSFDMDLDGGFSKFSSFKIDLSGLDLSPPSKKQAVPKKAASSVMDSDDEPDAPKEDFPTNDVVPQELDASKENFPPNDVEDYHREVEKVDHGSPEKPFQVIEQVEEGTGTMVIGSATVTVDDAPEPMTIDPSIPAVVENPPEDAFEVQVLVRENADNVKSGQSELQSEQPARTTDMTITADKRLETGNRAQNALVESDKTTGLDKFLDKGKRSFPQSRLTELVQNVSPQTRNVERAQHVLPRTEPRSLTPRGERPPKLTKVMVGENEKPRELALRPPEREAERAQHTERSHSLAPRTERPQTAMNATSGEEKLELRVLERTVSKEIVTKIPENSKRSVQSPRALTITPLRVREEPLPTDHASAKNVAGNDVIKTPEIAKKSMLHSRNLGLSPLRARPEPALKNTEEAERAPHTEKTIENVPLRSSHTEILTTKISKDIDDVMETTEKNQPLSEVVGHEIVAIRTQKDVEFGMEAIGSNSQQLLPQMVENETAAQKRLKELENGMENEKHGAIVEVDNEIIAKADESSKDLEDMCKTLRQKHEEAKELLVRALVSNNQLMMLNSPMLEEKLQVFRHSVEELLGEI